MKLELKDKEKAIQAISLLKRLPKLVMSMKHIIVNLTEMNIKQEYRK
jgi:hypothetical protein